MPDIHDDIVKRLKEELKKQLPEIEKNGDWLWKHPETGYREAETQNYCLEVLKRHGLTYRTYPDITGFISELDTGREGPVIGILGEMDSVMCLQHPDCNKETGAAHACGHSIQMASAIGAFVTLAESGVMEKLNGKILLFAVPAEECLETDWRLEEIKKGHIHYLGGKQEFIFRRAFEGVDVVINMHSGSSNDGTIRPVGRHNGFISKTVVFQGRASHAAAAPEQGINALYMANTALAAMNGLRETFRDEDRVRIHAIIAKGGESSNVIPNRVRIEAQCRANNIEAELDASEKFDRAMGGGAYAFGGQAVVKTQPGYLPYIPTKELDEAAIMTAEEILGPGRGLPGQDTAGSEDLGDLNSILPAIQVFVNYMEGTHHAADYKIADKKIYESSALFLAAFACRLMENNGFLAKKIKNAHRPLFSGAEEYCGFLDPLFSEKILP